jgi:hypothetical protein
MSRVLEHDFRTASGIGDRLLDIFAVSTIAHLLQRPLKIYVTISVNLTRDTNNYDILDGISHNH